MLTIAAPPAEASAGTAALVNRNVPTTLMSRMRVNSSSVISTNGLAISMPALFTSRSRPPKASTAAATAAVTSAVDRTSQAMPMHPLPSSAAAALAPSPLMSAIATLAPPATSRFAIARPIPRAAPETIARRPNRSFILFSPIILSQSVIEVVKRGPGRVVPAHAVRAGTRWRGRRTDIEAGHAGGVGRQRYARSEGQLPDVFGSGHDGAAGVVRVVCGHRCRGAHGMADDPVPEAGCEALDLGDDRLGGVAGVAVGHVGVTPYGVHVSDGPLRIRKILLPDEDERPFGHSPRGDVALGRGDLGERPGQVHGPGFVRVSVGPRHAALDGEVDLERARPTPEAAVRARHSARQAVSKDFGDRLGREIEQGDVGGRELTCGVDADPGLDLAAQVEEHGRHRVGDAA